MKVLIVTYDCKPGRREDFISAVKAEGIDQASRNEAGNVRYDYFRADADENRLLLLETWKDEEAFKAHGASAHFKRLGEIKEKFVAETVIEKYDKD
ncbi:MAG: putative quinol monooxygenase [Anaerovoracaceae bacterium]|jgi:quinol monooxygenase YgiN